MPKPEQVKICVTLDTGGIVIMSIVTNDFKNVVMEPTIANIDREVARSAAHGWPGTPVSWRTIEDNDIPPTREFRDAWEDKGGKIRLNPEKVRVLRAERMAAEAIRAEQEAHRAQLRDQFLKEIP